MEHDKFGYPVHLELRMFPRGATWTFFQWCIVFPVSDHFRWFLASGVGMVDHGDDGDR